MEYLNFLCCCCKNTDQQLSLRISCNWDCCKKKTYKFNIEKQENIDKIIKLLDQLNESNQKK